jgi:transcriptional regulator with XRE-family HTH domain
MSLDTFNALLELLDALLKARQEAGLTQAELAARIGTQAPAVARLERRRALATGKHSPSVATLRRYVKAKREERLCFRLSPRLAAGSRHGLDYIWH